MTGLLCDNNLIRRLCRVEMYHGAVHNFLI